jgi:hypothetical protein
VALITLGNIHSHQGDEKLARATAEASWQHAQAAGDDALIGSALARLAGYLEHTFRFGTDEGLACLAAIEAQDAHYERAAMLLGASHAMGYPPVFDQPIHDRLEREFYAPAKAHYGAQAWSQAERAGAALSSPKARRLAPSRGTAAQARAV